MITIIIYRTKNFHIMIYDRVIDVAISHTLIVCRV